MTLQMVELDRVVNITIVVLPVFFLYHLKSSDFNICNKSYDPKTKKCTVRIRVWIDFELHLIELSSFSILGLALSLSSSRTLSFEFELEVRSWRLILLSFGFNLILNPTLDRIEASSTHYLLFIEFLHTISKKKVNSIN